MIKSILLWIVVLTVCFFRVLPYFTRPMPKNSDETVPNYVKFIRDKFIYVTEKTLPSPHSELLQGMVLGIDSISSQKLFYDNCRNAGLSHVIVVSGFNVTLIISGLDAFLRRSIFVLKKHRIITLITLVWFYAIVCGFNPPVVRAAVMSSLGMYIPSYGRVLGGLKALILSVVMITILWPYMIFQFSFHLTCLATLGLILFSENVSNYVSKLGGRLGTSSIAEDFSISLAAQVYVWPLISYKFGVVNVLAPFINAFILWSVPIATIFGFVLLILSFLSTYLGMLMTLSVFPFLDIFVRYVNFVASFDFINMSFTITPLFMIFYYILVEVFRRYLVYKSNRNFSKLAEIGSTLV